MTFKPGDRVRVYLGGAKDVPPNFKDGMVNCVWPKSALIQKEDTLEILYDDGTRWTAHRKQVRRLVKRTRREIWVNEWKYGLGSSYHIDKGIAESYKNHPDYIRTIRFVEAKEK